MAKSKLMKQGITEEEIAKIETFPVRSFTFGNEKRKGAIDFEHNRVFMLDDKGNITGDYVVLKGNKMDALRNSYSPSIAVNQPTAGQTDGNPPAADPGSGSSSASETSGEPTSFMGKLTAKLSSGGNGKGKVSMPLLLSFCGVSLVLGAVFSLLIINAFGGIGTPKDNSPTADTQRFAAVQIQTDALPGQVITESMISKVIVDGNTFNQAALSGGGLYGWDEAPYLVGMYISEYTPAGECLTYNSVSGIYDTPVNPFLKLNDGYAYLDIPVKLSYAYIDSIVIGRYMDITLEVKTQYTRPEHVETDEVPGLDHSSSITEQVVTDIYKLQDVVILDMTAADGSSLFETMSVHNAVPDGELQAYLTGYADKLLSENPDMTPDQLLTQFCVTSIRIQLPADQVKAIGKLKGESTAVKIHNVSDNYMVNTTAQQDYILEARYTTRVMATVFGQLF